MGPVGVQEMVVIFLVALVLFGPKKLPELGKGLGESIRGFKTAISTQSYGNSGLDQFCQQGSIGYHMTDRIFRRRGSQLDGFLNDQPPAGAPRVVRSRTASPIAAF